eukprot:ANDGO_06786.mRNA.1 hypothetical protein
MDQVGWRASPDGSRMVPTVFPIDDEETIRYIPHVLLYRELLHSEQDTQAEGEREVEAEAEGEGDPLDQYELLGEGDLHVTSRSLYFLTKRSESLGFRIAWSAVAMHAVGHTKRSCIYLQIDGPRTDDEAVDGKIDEAAESLQFQIVPADAKDRNAATLCDSMYDTFSKCVEMNPDIDEDDENQDFEGMDDGDDDDDDDDGDDDDDDENNSNAEDEDGLYDDADEEHGDQS